MKKNMMMSLLVSGVMVAGSVHAEGALAPVQAPVEQVAVAPVIVETPVAAPVEVPVVVKIETPAPVAPVIAEPVKQAFPEVQAQPKKEEVVEVKEVVQNVPAGVKTENQADTASKVQEGGESDLSMDEFKTFLDEINKQEAASSK